jgi:hypothetical protein
MILRDDLAADATPEKIAEYVSQNAAALGHSGHGHGHGDHGGATESVREATYKGHRIMVRTTYQIEVDGKPVEGHLAVTNDGRVHYHTLPNISYASAIDLVQQVIDSFPDDFAPPDQHT